MRFAGYAVLALTMVASLSLGGCGPGIEEVREVAASPPPEEMALPEPRLQRALSLKETLARRRSVRSFTEEELTLEEISQLLWAAQGMTAASASAGDAAQDFLTESNLNQPGLVRVAMAGAQPISDNGGLLALEFDVVGGVGDTSPLQIAAIELNEDGVTAQPQDGSISVVDFPDHDFNRDCNVDVEDIMEVASRWHTTDADPDWDALYDLDGDGIITIVDIMIVAVNWGATCW
ncbi:MAG: nitroreductase family protein [Anaerolineae bacterium]